MIEVDSSDDDDASQGVALLMFFFSCLDIFILGMIPLRE
jgi:hypothetical protein